MKTVYFIGIGGIGMSALARYFKLMGATVSGYDKTPTRLTKQLQTEGINIHFEEDVEAIPKQVDLIVYTPAIPKDHAELVYLREQGYELKKRAAVLGEITKGYFTIAVAGTHGKTTVSSMITHLLKHTGYDCTAFVGGIMRNFESNFVWGQNKVMVVEADEYDRSFLQLHPDVAIITATDADHLDIYDTHEGVKAGFNTFASQVKEKLILQKRTEIVGQTADKIITYALQAEQKQVTSTIQNLEVLDGAYRFDWQSPQGLVKSCTLNVGGKHNIENAIAAMTIAQYLGIETEAIKVALAAFKGIKRRFEYVVKRTDLVIIDDYAHHPEEVRVLLESVRELYPSKKITAVFQPHLYTRTRDFATGFAETLSLADEVVVLDIYPARELPIKGIDAELILRQMNLEQKYNFNLTNVISWLREKKLEILVLIGAGSIGTLAPKLKEIY